jgi:DHA3 family macrolide efflux protein-like MFS transporter
MKINKRPAGMSAFIIIWIGQIISILASSMSQFGLTIWMYQQTKSATAMGLMQVFFITPFLLFTPFAGVMVDRYNRKIMMMVSDLFAVISTFGVFILYSSGHLQFWHLYVAATINGIGNTFQWPAYSAVISTMIPKKDLGRANGLTSLLEAGPGVLAPALAGAFIPIVGLTGLLFFDFATFFIAIGTLFFVIIPATPKTEEGLLADQGNLLQQAAFGFKYIFVRPSLLGLQLIFFFENLFSGMAFTLLAPMLLARTQQNSLVFGIVESVFAVGGVIGAILMSTWGGFKRRIHGVLLGWVITSIGTILLGLGQNLYFWIPAAFLSMLVSPLINGSNQAIWQSKVAPDLQGRVFSARRLIAWLTNPLSPIIAGTLADFVFEPAMNANGTFSPLLGKFIGIGPGSGMGSLMVLCGIFGVCIGLSGYLFPIVARAEEILPDYTPLKLSPNTLE